MGFLQDALAVFRKTELSFLEGYKDSGDVYTFVFKNGKDLSWEAGQHGLFQITHKKIKDSTKPFTIASAPAENVIKITTRISEHPSEFKQALLELKQGMTVKMSGPLGAFRLEEDKPAIFIAGGIGITPFRSMIKQLEAEGTSPSEPIQLLYLNSDKKYLFKEDVEDMVNNNLLNVTYLDSRDQLTEELGKAINQYKSNGQYFIAGPKAMVDSTANYLKNNSIPKRNIRKDAFFGY